MGIGRTPENKLKGGRYSVQYSQETASRVAFEQKDGTVIFAAESIPSENRFDAYWSSCKSKEEFQGIVDRVFPSEEGVYWTNSNGTILGQLGANEISFDYTDRIMTVHVPMSDAKNNKEALDRIVNLASSTVADPEILPQDLVDRLRDFVGFLPPA